MSDGETRGELLERRPLSADLLDAQDHYYSAGGLPSQYAGGREAPWYWRRAAKSWRAIACFKKPLPVSAALPDVEEQAVRVIEHDTSRARELAIEWSICCVDECKGPSSYCTTHAYELGQSRIDNEAQRQAQQFESLALSALDDLDALRRGLVALRESRAASLEKGAARG